MLEARHINLFLNSIFQGFGAEEVKVVECIDTYLEKMSFSSQDAYYVGVNQTFSSRSFEYQNQSKLPLSIRAKNLHIKNAKRILLISHDDSLSGAPLFALQIYRQMVSQGFRVQLLVLKRASSYSASSPFSDSMLDLVYLEDVFPKNEVLISPHSTKDQLAIMCNAILGSFKPDIVMANTVVSAEWAVKAAAAGIPSVLLVHETWGFKVEGPLGYSPEEIVIRESFESANLVVFGSSAARERWQDSKLSPNSLVLPSHRVINPTNWMKSFEKIELRHTLGIPEHAFVYLSVGSFEERKRTLDAIQSFVAFSSDSDFLVLVGDWSLNDSYCSTVRKQAAKFTNIKIIETTPDLERYYFTADCFILMSASEVYPLVLQEAAAYGLPRIISKFDGFRECVESVNSALFYETGDLEKLTELMQLIRDSSEMREVIIRESQSEVQNNEAEASQYIDRLFNRLATPHVTSVRIAIND
jgi:glycosyltransferase involved in cell wall biosynthesis